MRKRPSAQIRQVEKQPGRSSYQEKNIGSGKMARMVRDMKDLESALSDWYDSNGDVLVGVTGFDLTVGGFTIKCQLIGREQLEKARAEDRARRMAESEQALAKAKREADKAIAEAEAKAKEPIIQPPMEPPVPLEEKKQ